MLHAAEQAHAERPTFNARIAAAQGVLESGDPPSQLAMRYGNCLGIKAGTTWGGPTVDLRTGEETPAGEAFNTNAAFRVYPSWFECFKDYARIIGSLPWYADATANASDPIAYLLGLVTPGEPSYATDTRYVEKVLRVAYRTGLLPESNGRVHALGRHAVLVDNSPTVAKALTVLSAALSRQPAVHGPHLATRTRRPDGSWKLDVRAPVNPRAWRLLLRRLMRRSPRCGRRS